MTSQEPCSDPGPCQDQAGDFELLAVTLLCLSGSLHADATGDLEVRVCRHAAAARAAGQCLIVDMSGVSQLSGAAAAALDAAVHRGGGVPVTVAAPDPGIRAVLARLLSDVDIKPTLADAAAAVTARVSAAEVEAFASKDGIPGPELSY